MVFHKGSDCFVSLSAVLKLNIFFLKVMNVTNVLKVIGLS